MSYLDQIAARIEGATRGAWSVYTTRGGTYVTRPDLLGVAREWSLVWQDGDAEFIAHARTDLPRLLAAVRAVEAVHEPIDALNVRINRIQKVCTGCGTDDGNWQVWPCPTIRALTEALEGEG